MSRLRISTVVTAWVLFAAGLFTCAHAAPPAFQAAGTAQTGVGAVTPAWPAHAVGDVALLFVESAGGEAATLSTPAGFVAVTNSPQATGAGTAGTRITVFWARATSTAMPAPTVADAGDHVYAQIITYRGVIASGNPWDVTGGGVKAAASTTVSVTGVTTTVPDALVVQAVARDISGAAAAFSAETNSNLGAITERSDAGSASGNGGGFAVWDGSKVVPGATGDTSATVTSSVNAFITIALKPPAAPVISSAFDQSFSTGDPPMLAATITVVDNPSGAVITATNDLRIRIPATFNATWDSSVSTVTVSGGGAGKVSATLSAYEASNRVAVINVTSNFAAGDVLIISGLRFANFTAASAADNLELVVAGAAGATADTDDKTITVLNQGISSAGSRFLNDNASRTPIAAEDVDVTNWDPTVPFLVTLGFQTTASGAADCRNGQGANKLQWRNVTDAPGVWNTLGTTAGPEMVLFASANLSHGGQLTLAEAQIVGSGGWINGQEAENSTNINWGGRVRNGDHSAIQFSIDPSGGTPGKTYQFRFIVDQLCFGTSTGSPSVVSATITLEAPVTTPGAFNAFETSTAANAITGVIRTKVAGSAFSLDVVAIASGAQLNAFTNPVTVELLGNNTLSVALDANNCPTSSTTLQTVSPAPTVTGGRSTVNFAAVANSWRDVRVRVRYPTGSPTVTSCSTDNFAIRPNMLANLAASDTDWLSAGTGRPLNDVTFGAVTHKAGRPFSVRATAQNAASATTTNYSGTATANLTGCTGAACTSGFGTFTVGAAFSAGQLTTDAASYDDVGAFKLRLEDRDFANVDAADTTGDCTGTGRYVCSGTLDVGRFVPDHFAVAIVPGGASFAAACGSFTYVGQLFKYTSNATRPVMTVTAQNFANGTTMLYTGNWWRISNTTLTPNTQGGRYSAATANPLDTALLPDVAADPTIDSATPGAGVGTLTFNSGTGLAFTRPTSTSSTPVPAPLAPFDADISLAVNIIDADGVAHASNPARFGQASTGNGIAFTGGKAMRFGMLRLENAVGSEKLSLPVPIQIQYFNGTSFTKNTDDTCTSISTANFGFGSYSGGITATNMNGTHISGLGTAFSSGFFTLTAPSPTPASAGAVTLTIDLTAEAKTYLKGNWGVSAYTADPSSRDAFGLFGIQGQPNNFIYFRENY